MEAVKADAGLQEKLNAAANVDVVVEIAKEAGFMISADELQRAQPSLLSEDEELERVAGGMGKYMERYKAKVKLQISIALNVLVGCKY